ncbi:MAG: replication-associated recombination protein A [Chitinophagales bacterium]|nr:replication-associated recombination protein A [Chitinophagales bacterium]
MHSHNRKPLAERMRPQRLEDFVGQSHLIGPDQVLRRMTENGQLFSLILWGPPGSGKTSLARILAVEGKRPLLSLSAVHSGVREVRQAIEQSKRLGQAVLFLDELHRFSKSQQDALLPAVERGDVILIGATTENPSLEIISPLLSRCQVYALHPLESDDLLLLLHRALERDEWLRSRQVTVVQSDALLRLSGGDARRMFNLVEQAVNTTPSGPVRLTDDLVMRVAQRRIALHDKDGEQHYQLISAFIKSVRGSDPNAAVYWLARLIAGGEDPLFICRRMIVLAAEDVGLANPAALPAATACYQAVELIGMPEGRIVMAEMAVYLACSAKSNSCYKAIQDALAEVDLSGALPVPLHLRNAPTPLMKEWGYGSNYQYDHDVPGHFAGQEFLPPELHGRRFYDPASNEREQRLRQFLRERWGEIYGY